MTDTTDNKMTLDDLIEGLKEHVSGKEYPHPELSGADHVGAGAVTDCIEYIEANRPALEAGMKELAKEEIHDDLIRKWLDDELADYEVLMRSVSEVYYHITGGKLSKPNTDPKYIIIAHDDAVTEAERRNEDEDDE